MTDLIQMTATRKDDAFYTLAHGGQLFGEAYRCWPDMVQGVWAAEACWDPALGGVEKFMAETLPGVLKKVREYAEAEEAESRRVAAVEEAADMHGDRTSDAPHGHDGYYPH